MRLCLQISQREGGKGSLYVRRFSFAVLDLEKAEEYPLNFVCMLPMNLGSDGRAESAFVKVFGYQSTEMAQKLLLEAMKRETDAEVKAEVERRLKLLEPKPDVEKRCLACGKFFPTKPKPEFKQKYCPECLKKKIWQQKIAR
jgi:hypothetical protein